MPSTPLAADQRALLSVVGVGELPQPIPAGLLTLPIFRAAVKQGEVDANGVLPEAARRAQVIVAEPAGRYTYYEITGDPKLGLPYGGDADVLLAMAALADRADAEGRPHVHPVTGEFVAPSLRMLARVLDLDMTKDRAERIKGALDRLAAVRIRAARLRQLDEVAGRADPVSLPAGNAHPIFLEGAAREEGAGAPGRVVRRPRVPRDVAAALPGGEWVPEAEGMEYLITYAWRTEYHRTARGEDWIQKLQINPALLAQAERGWVGWIDCPTHARLTRPIAKRLYQLTANAQARQAPLRFELAALRQLCGIAGGTKHVRSAHVRDDVLAAAQELVAADVLAGAEVTSVVRGRYVFHFEPGLRLRVAGWLRGVGTPDFTEQRVLRLLLASLDVAPRAAEQLVAESAGQVRQMLAYVFFQRERGQAVHAPGRYVVDGVAKGWSYDGNEEFQRWFRERVAHARPAPRLAVGGDAGASSDRAPVLAPHPATPAVLNGGAPGAAVAAGGAVTPAPRDAVDPLPLALPPLGADESGWWDAVLCELLPAWHPLVRAYLARARPACRTGVTLLVVAHSDGESARLSREAHLLSDALARASAGAACEVLVLSPQQWRARAADVGAADVGAADVGGADVRTSDGGEGGPPPVPQPAAVAGPRGVA
ncbi:hypothetical protein tb265_43500 [Gemmatimonadetes bacterium T265]|nr:hypothetical protein tb265_43500 [Gemmatimonadetes bacterium T265]